MTFREWNGFTCCRFLLTCLLRGMTSHPFSLPTGSTFLLTCLLRGMTFGIYPRYRIRHVSTHMPLARHDRRSRRRQEADCSFYSHASCEAWRVFLSAVGTDQGFYSHASCEAWHRVSVMFPVGYRVSTHMPLARHDVLTKKNGKYLIVSTHMPLARHDLVGVVSKPRFLVSTHMPLARHDTQT